MVDASAIVAENRLTPVGRRLAGYRLSSEEDVQ